MKGPLPNTFHASGGCAPDAPNGIVFHPMLFAFGETASMKSLPELNTSLRLAEEILMAGFLSHTEPLHVVTLVVPGDGSATDYQIPLRSIGYLKGQS